MKSHRGAGHKLYAPKGIGALFLREGASLEPLIHGAGHEAGRRAGTENVVFDVGLGRACEIAEEWLEDRSIWQLTDRFYDGIKKLFGQQIRLNGHVEKRLPNTLFISFPGMVGEEILKKIPDLCTSTGAACHDQSVTLSHVLAAMGVNKEVGMGAIRLTLGRPTTQEEVDQASQWIVETVDGMRVRKTRV